MYGGVADRMEKTATPNNAFRLLWFALLATIVWGVIISVEAGQFQTADCPTKNRLQSTACLLTSPIAELELATKAEQFKEILDQGSSDKNEPWNIEIARVNTWMDFLFIALYWSVFFLFALYCGGLVSHFVTVSISVAAICDIVENIFIFHTLRSFSSHAMLELLPGIVSRVKWSTFAIALVLLAIVLAKRESKALKGIAALMFVSAAVTISGVFVVSLLSLALVLLFAALLIAVLRYVPFSPFSWANLWVWLELAYLLRFQLIAALLLAIIFPMGYFAAPSIFIGLFDARRFWSFTFVVWAAFQLAWSVMIACRLVWAYGPERFEGLKTLPKAKRLDWADVGLFAGLATPCVVMVSCGTDLIWWSKVGGITFGFIIAFVVLVLTAKVHSYFEPDPRTTVFPPFRFQKSREDADQAESGRLVDRSGHKLAWIALGVEFAMYILTGLVFNPKYTAPENEPAALFFALLLITFLTWLLAGVAFFVDSRRLPVLSTILSLSLLSGVLAHTDHQFEITPSRETLQVDLSPRRVVQQWKAARHKSPDAPVVIVATAGGGIRAAAWTAQVLTGLESTSRARECQERFSSSLVLISSVSGGSVGSMFFLRRYDSDGTFPADNLAFINSDASRSSLSAVGWGLLYPDFARTVPLVGALVPRYKDRGWALEYAWTTGWKNPPNISDWRRDVAAGNRPAAIFNATAAENGERFLIASTDIQKDVLDNEKGETQLMDNLTMQFADDFAKYDMPVATAARLSATFPYVSPITQASLGEERVRVHVADGAYYDNSGVLSALEWMEEARAALRGHPVLFLLIDAEPDSPKAGKPWSWQRQLVAPIDTLMNVRTASQQFRGRLELQLGRRQLKADEGVDVEPISFLFSTPMPSPLSWHLTPQQQDSIVAKWNSKEIADSEEKVMSFMGCPK